MSNNRKAKYLLAFIVIFLQFSFALGASAGNLRDAFKSSGPLTTVAEDKAGYTKGSFEEMVGMVIGVFLSILGVIFVCFMVYAGFMWMTARGDETKVRTALSIIRTSIIGLIIILSAYAISRFVITTLTNSTMTDTGPGLTPGPIH